MAVLRHGGGFNALLARLIAAVLLLAGLTMLLPLASGAGGETANVQFIWDIAAPVVGVTASLDGRHVAVVDEEARFTLILDHGDRAREWGAPPCSS